MITRELLKKEGFIKDFTSPSSVEDFYLKKLDCGYISIRFKPNANEPCGMFAYFENPDHSNVRKVVMNDTIISDEDFEMAKKLCRCE